MEESGLSRKQKMKKWKQSINTIIGKTNENGNKFKLHIRLEWN